MPRRSRESDHWGWRRWFQYCIWRSKAANNHALLSPAKHHALLFPAHNHALLSLALVYQHAKDQALQLSYPRYE